MSAVGKEEYQSIKDILKFIISFLIKQDILNLIHLIINLWILDDRRNVRQKVKYIMVTCAILNNKEHLYLSNYHFTIVLYSRSKNYKTLKSYENLEATFEG